MWQKHPDAQRIHSCISGDNNMFRWRAARHPERCGRIDLLFLCFKFIFTIAVVVAITIEHHVPWQATSLISCLLCPNEIEKSASF